MSSQTSEKLQVLRGDVFGGLTAAVVALPLSLAFGVASGLGAVAGLYGAIVVGLLGALLGGSKTQISGPTAPLSVAMAVVFVDYANQDLGKALAIVALAGLIQVLMGALRLGSYMAYTPYAVVSGFTSAVGLIIILVQFLPLLGSEVALGGALKSPVPGPKPSATSTRARWSWGSSRSRSVFSGRNGSAGSCLRLWPRC